MHSTISRWPRKWRLRIAVILASALLSQLCTGISFPAQSTATALLVSPAPALNGASQSVAPGQTPQGIDPDAWTRMMGQVQAETYAAHPDPQQRGTWVADNPAQRLGARFTGSGVSFTIGSHADRERARAPSGAAAVRALASTFHLRTRIGKTPTRFVTPISAGNRIEYRHPDYTEWYVNDASGFEQGWTLNKPVEGGKPAHIRIEVSGARTVAEGEGSIRIEDRNGKLRYRYAGLKAWDADHRAIPATLRLARAGRIDITLRDQGARYPVTVDPTLTATQEVVLSESAAYFGYAVAVDGDTVVVSASQGNNAQGQVFIFGRNQGGAGAWGLTNTLNDPCATAGDLFGAAVAVNGDVLAAAGSCSNAPGIFIFERNNGGAGVWGMASHYSNATASGAYAVTVYGDTVVAGGSGSAVILTRFGGASTEWGTVMILADPAGVSSDCYGCAVAVNGSTLVVGAPGTASGQGKAYVYSLVPAEFTVAWQLSATLSDPPASAGDAFGASVAANGDTIVVGAYGGNSSQGHVYVFGRNQGNTPGSWGLAKTLNDPAATASDFFGCAVTVDGDFLVVGSYGAKANQGAAYVFARNQGGAGAWGLAATLAGPTTAYSDYGRVVAVNGDSLIVGAYDVTAAYIYDLSGGTSSVVASIADPMAKNYDSFGYSVAVNGDTVVVGASGYNSNQGSVYIFERNQGGAGAWGLAVTLGDPLATANDYFGYSVAVDGDTIVVGAFGSNSSAGEIYIYLRNQGGSGAWGFRSSLSSGGTSPIQFGSAVAINGSTLIVSSNAFVGIYEMDQGSGGLESVKTLTKPSGAVGFGNSVAIYGDTLIVGASETSNDQGAAYIYSRLQGGVENWGNIATLIDPAEAIDDYFGSAIAVNGSTAVVGALGYNGAQGRAYVYGATATGGWGLIATLQDPAATASDEFGNAVAVSGDTVVVGSRQAHGYLGAAYVFNRNAGGTNGWGLTATQADPSAGFEDSFGNAVAVDGETVVIGASNANTTQGKAYILSIQQGTADASIVWLNTNGQVVLWNMNGAVIASAPNLGTVPAGWSIVGTADFDGDGNPDILWRNTSGAVVVWFTNGTTVTSSINLGTIPTSWTVSGTGDFNGDGKADILWRNSNGDTVIWFMSAGGIASSSDLGVVATSWSVAGTGDFNDDGDADILWRNSNGDVVIWFMNSGTISSSADLGVVPAAWSIAGTGDFNGDGHRDILWRNSNGDVVIWFMNGGTISSSADLGVVPAAWSIEGTGDFNGDSKDDILWRNTNGDTVIWFMNGGTISSSADLGVVAASWSIAGVDGH